MMVRKLKVRLQDFPRVSCDNQVSIQTASIPLSLSLHITKPYWLSVTLTSGNAVCVTSRSYGWSPYKFPCSQHFLSLQCHVSSCSLDCHLASYHNMTFCCPYFSPRFIVPSLSSILFHLIFNRFFCCSVYSYTVAHIHHIKLKRYIDNSSKYDQNVKNIIH